MTAPRTAGQLRLTAAAAVATALAALGMDEIFSGRGWLSASVLVIAAVAATGGLGRLVTRSRAAVLALQVLVAALVVTARFAPENALLGAVPTRTTLNDLTELARVGGQAINQQTVPVLDLPAVVLLVALGVAVVAIVVDFTAVACRCPALSGVMLLALYAVPVVVLPDGASWRWFLAAAAGWLLLLYVAQREALRDWSTTNAVTPPDATTSWSTSLASPRAALAWQVAGAALVLPVLLVALLPGVGDGALGRVGENSGSGSGGSTASKLRLDLTATVQRGLSTPSNTPLLNYQSTTGLQQYLRLAVLDRFDGVTWSASTPAASSPGVVGTAITVPGLEDTANPPSMATTITPTGRASDLAYMPSPYLPTAVSGLTDDWRWDTATSTVFSRSAKLDNRTFTVTSKYVEPAPAQLAGQRGATTLKDDTNVPPAGLPTTVAATAARVTEGADTDYAKAVALQDWFLTNFTYDLAAPPTNSATAIQTFLTDRRGYCQQFAATYALMARTLGLHARVVVGFAPGSPVGDGVYTVGSHDYHAWPELWFDGIGWVRFEPTPRTGAGSTVDRPSWSLPGPLAPVNRPTASAAPTTAPSPAASAPTRRALPDGTTATVSTTPTDRLRSFAPVAGAALLVLLAAGPGLARALRRRRRLAPMNGPDGIEAAWAELADTATDLGLPWRHGDTPRRTTDAFARQAGLDGPGSAALDRVRRDVEQVRYAGTVTLAPRAEGSAADAVRTVRDEVMGNASRAARWRARLLPPTMFRRRRSQ